MVRVLLGVALVAVVLVACGGGSDAPDGATATATSRRLPQGSPVTTAGIASPGPTEQARGTQAAGTPTPTQVFNYCNTDVPEASATPSQVRTLPVGHACVADAGDDVKSESGSLAVNPVPGADIAAARIDSNGSVLLVTFYGNQRIPVKLDDGTAISWNVEILHDNQAIYHLSIKLEPGNWDIVITDVATGDTEKLRLASIYGKRLETPFKAELLPKLTGPFTFRAWTESSGADGVVVYDWVPDAVAANRTDPEAAIPFPAQR